MFSKNFSGKNYRGYTLIELLAAIAVFFFLTAVGVVALQNARENSRDAQRKGDANQLSAALGAYFNSVGNGSYPAQAVFVCLDFSSLPIALIDGVKPIMTTMPSDPLIARNTVNTGCYAYRGGKQDFKIIMALENDPGLMADDGGVLENRYEIYTPGARSWQ